MAIGDAPDQNARLPVGARRPWMDWFSQHEKHWRRLALALVAVIVLIQWVRVARKPFDGDFFLHWQFGGHMVAHEILYTDGLDIPYPPFWALAWAGLSLLPLSVAKTLWYPASLVALAALLFVLSRLTRRHLPLSATGRFWCAALALALTSRFLVRELPECGPNLTLLALVWLAIYAWSRRREWLGGLSLGVAIALKCTPGLFLVYFAWKRQWKMVAATTLVAGACTLAPAIWQGPESYGLHMRLWASNVWLSTGKSDPSMGALGEEPVQNLALRPAVARYLMRLPKGHISRLESPWYVDFLDFAPATAGNLVKVVMLALMAGVAWALRRPLDGRDGPQVAWQCAAIGVLALLMSPITWGQHCVAMLPAFYLIARRAVAGPGLSRWMLAPLGAFVVVNLLLNRGLFGRDFALLLDSYHLPTATFVGVLWVTLACHAQESAERQAASAPDAFQQTPSPDLRRLAA